MLNSKYKVGEKKEQIANAPGDDTARDQVKIQFHCQMLLTQHYMLHWPKGLKCKGSKNLYKIGIYAQIHIKYTRSFY